MDGSEKTIWELQAEALLRRLGNELDRPMPIAEAAIAFATLQRPVDPRPYFQHLVTLAHDVGTAAAASEDAPEELGAVIAGVHGYNGDSETYDDLDNADLLRVIERRRGLPVALGILYIHIARAQGWTAAGLAMPGHFVIQVEAGSKKAIIDPFHAGSPWDPRRFGDVFAKAEPNSSYYQPVPDREVLLRLQNNIKSRLIKSGAIAQAAAVVERMLLLAPQMALLWRDFAVMQWQLGHLVAAEQALESGAMHAENMSERETIARLQERLKGRLN